MNFGEKTGKIIAKNIGLGGKKEALTKEELDRRIAEYQLFYLYNLDKYVVDILRIEGLKEFQLNFLAEFPKYNQLDVFGSRRYSKSFLASLGALCMCTILPNYRVLVVSHTLSQADIILKQKVDEMFTSPSSTKFNSPTLQYLRTLGWIKVTQEKSGGGSKITFGNGSTMFTSASGESCRGLESHLIIGDEAALFNMTDYLRIVRPTGQRYLHKGLVLEPKEVLLTSARDRSNWYWKRAVDNVNQHYKSTKRPRTGFICGDIITSVLNGIQSLETFNKIKKTTDEYTLLSEYFNIWLGDSGQSIFKYADFTKAQTNDKAYYPKYLGYDFCKEVKTNDNWVRVQSVDIALASGNENDRTSIWLGKINVKTNQRVIEYGLSLSGKNALEQSRIVKRLFYDYGAEYSVIDTRGLGLSFYDILTQATDEVDFDLDIKKFKNNQYPSWTVSRDKALQISSDSVLKDKIQRTFGEDWHSVVVPFVGTSEINSQAHYSVYNALKNNDLVLLKPKAIVEQEAMEKDAVFFTRTSEEKAEYFRPFLETDILINETVSLNVTRNGTGQLKVTEGKRRDLKDRYSSFAMFNLLCDKIYNKHIAEEYELSYDVSDFSALYD